MSLLDNIELCMIVLSRDPVRLNNFKTMKTRFPQLKYFEAVDWKNDWNFILRFFENNYIPIKSMPSNTKGKYARWVSVILFAKYVIDTNSKGAILIEDDVLLPQNFNFRYKFYKKCNFCKLSQWGEGYFMNKKGAKRFLKSIYRIGINHHNDMFIMNNHIFDKRFLVITKKHLICKTNQGNIRSSKCNLSNKNLKKLTRTPTLIKNKIFEEGLDRYQLNYTFKETSPDITNNNVET